MMGKFDMVYRRSTREFKKMFQSFFLIAADKRVVANYRFFYIAG